MNSVYKVKINDNGKHWPLQSKTYLLCLWPHFHFYERNFILSMVIFNRPRSNKRKKAQNDRSDSNPMIIRNYFNIATLHCAVCTLTLPLLYRAQSSWGQLSFSYCPFMWMLRYSIKQVIFPYYGHHFIFLFNYKKKLYILSKLHCLQIHFW